MPDWLAYAWYEISSWITRATLTALFSLRCQGGDNVPRRGPVLLVANHQSFLDPPLVGVGTRRHLAYLARKTLFRHRLWGALLRGYGAVAVDQEGVAKEGLRTILEKLKEGKAVLVFPEGERTGSGEMSPLKPGIHLLIRRTAAPIVPVGIAGAFDALPRTRKWPRLAPLLRPPRRGTVAVAFGHPIPTEHYAEMPREKVLSELSEAIQRVQQQAEHLRRK